MLVRIRWFVLGALAAFGGMVYAAGQVAKAKEKMTLENVARAGARVAMDRLDKGLDAVAELIGTSRSASNGDGAATH
ncbi:MAG: hypothetical protein KJP12_01665 [Acidimicrobiia bacterium]|nr:hypothetical protein [Acidimicrobiia bacterium]